MSQKFGRKDPDVRHKGSKEKTDKPMLKASTKTLTTGMIGGTSNAYGLGNKSEKKGASKR